jgi:hypothetical protein
MHNYKHFELAILNGAIAAPLNFVIFTTEKHNVKLRNLGSICIEAKEKVSDVTI